MTRERLLAGTPVTERRVQLAGATTALLEGGAGPPVVLLHGGIECGGVYWAPALSRLAERHRVVVPDVPGLGESEPVAQLDDVFADWLTAVIESTCDEKPMLVAHSLLGSLAARYAALRGDALRRLVIYGTPGVGPYRLPVGLLVAAILFDLRPSQRNSDRFSRWAFLDPDLTRRENPEWLDAFDAYTMARASTPHVKRTMRRLIKTCTKRVPDAELQRIQIPTDLIWGRHDRMVPLRVAEFASSTHGWPLHVIDGAGHVPHIEQPGAFLDALRPALETLTGEEAAA